MWGKAGASLGLLTPFAAQASDIVNLEEINSYSRSTKRKTSRLDSNTFTNKVSEDVATLETKQNVFEAGTFSSTTTMDGKVVAWIGGIDGISDVDDNADGQTSD